MDSKELIESIIYVADMDVQVRFYRDMFGLEVTYPAGLADYSDQFWMTLDAGLV